MNISPIPLCTYIDLDYNLSEQFCSVPISTNNRGSTVIGKLILRNISLLICLVYQYSLLNDSIS